MTKKLFLILAMCLFASAMFAQSLGDVARANRAKKHSNTGETKLDDDSMPHSISTASSAPDKDDKKSDDKDAATKDKDKDGDAKTADAKDGDAKDGKKDATDAKKQKSDELQKQIAEETKELATLQRELDIAQREARLRAAAYYGDAGTMLRDQAKYAEDTRKSQAEIDGKKQAVDAAQQKLSDLQEQARKAGLSQP